MECCVCSPGSFFFKLPRYTLNATHSVGFIRVIDTPGESSLTRPQRYGPGKQHVKHQTRCAGCYLGEQLAFLRQWLLANHSRTNAHYLLFFYGIRLRVRVRVRFRVNVSVSVRISVRVRVWVEGTFDKIDIRCFTCNLYVSALTSSHFPFLHAVTADKLVSVS